VFSPRGSDGAPVPMFDPRTGGVDPRVVRAWKAYDIRLILQERWALLAPELAGKIRVYAGSADNFYLEGAVALLGEWARSAGADMHVEVVEGLRHAPASHGMRHMAETIRQRWDDRQER
jgi:dienelactone hydrolase